MKRVHAMPFGTRWNPEGGVEFRLWAPSVHHVDCVIDGVPLPLQRDGAGWHRGVSYTVAAGARYVFQLDGGLVVPDPASRHNPVDVFGPSELVDPGRFDWPDGGWRGRPWHEAVLYELHVGTFTPEGRFDSVVDRLDALVALGVTAIELMPVADFPGRRGWGYDGVLPYAPSACYGPPDALKRLVAEAHARGLMVLLDVVYNHFGPDGNYLHAYAPEFFNPAVHTPWGAAINLDGPHSRTVRDYFLHNALYWLEEFHLDGLRLDAVHALHDSSPLHLVDELACAIAAGPGRERAIHLVVENELNDARCLARDDSGRPRTATAQWNDDVHHALHVLVTGECDGYYVDYARRPVALLGRALAEGFGYQGEPSAFRAGRAHGQPSTHLPPLAFVNALQTHDQVGNRALGERLATLAADAGRLDALRAVLACVLLSPSPPMLFMGEEWAASTPFLYFCDHAGDLARAVTEGRRREFARFERFADPAQRQRIPDPNAVATAAACTLDWTEPTRPGHAEWLALYTLLLQRRHQHLVPRLPALGSGRWRVDDDGLLELDWPQAGGGGWQLRAQLADRPARRPRAPLRGRRVYASHGPSAEPQPWSVQVHEVDA